MKPARDQLLTELALDCSNQAWRRAPTKSTKIATEKIENQTKTKHKQEGNFRKLDSLVLELQNQKRPAKTEIYRSRCHHACVTTIAAPHYNENFAFEKGLFEFPLDYFFFSARCNRWWIWVLQNQEHISDTPGILWNIPKNHQYLITFKKHTLEGRNIYSSLLDENPVFTY